jgi:cyclophilin family peptidyl-prolyl cis-trans isomerase
MMLVSPSTSSLLRRSCCSIQLRAFGTGGGSRGSRGHGWFHKYRQGLGGRHLQGEYWDAPTVDEWQEWNDSIFAYGSEEVSFSLKLEGEGSLFPLKLELATAILPKTTNNFQLLLHEGRYQNTKVHRIEKGVGLCMGDVLGLDGRGGACHSSLSTTGIMETEPLVLAHIPGIVTMLSPGVDKVDSRFMIVTNRAPQLDGRHVAFARLDMDSLRKVQQWEATVFTKRGRPTINMVMAGGPAGNDTPQQQVTAHI